MRSKSARVQHVQCLEKRSTKKRARLTRIHGEAPLRMLYNATPPNILGGVGQHPDNAIYVTVSASDGAKVRATCDWISNIHPFTPSAQNLGAYLPRPIEKACKEAILLFLFCLAILEEVKSGLLKDGKKEKVEGGSVGAEVGKDCREFAKEGARRCVDRVLECWVVVRAGWMEMGLGGGRAFASCRSSRHRGAKF